MNLLEMSLAGAVLIIAVLILRAIFINRLPKKNVCRFVGISADTAAAAVYVSFYI